VPAPFFFGRQRVLFCIRALQKGQTFCHTLTPRIRGFWDAPDSGHET
jgi:hypothetical protein